MSAILAGILLSSSVSLACGSLADLAPEDCCKSICQHEGDAKDARKCCQQNQQSKPSLGVPLADLTLAKKFFDAALFADRHPLDGWFDDVLVERTSVLPPKVLKFPQQEIYKLTAAFLI